MTTFSPLEKTVKDALEMAKEKARINPVDLLLLHARKQDARQGARHYSLFNLSEQARRFNLDPVTRWKVAGYLLGWMPWRDLEPDLMKARTIRFPIA